MPEWRAASRLKPVSSFKSRRALRKGSSKQVRAPRGETIDDIPLLTAFSPAISHFGRKLRQAERIAPQLGFGAEPCSRGRHVEISFENQ